MSRAERVSARVLATRKYEQYEEYEKNQRIVDDLAAQGIDAVRIECKSCRATYTRILGRFRTHRCK